MNVLITKKMIMFLFGMLLPLGMIAQDTKVTVSVKDLETGKAIENAEVGLSVHTSIQPGQGWGGGKSNRYLGKSDEKGLCILQGKGNGGSASVFARKEGYYGSSGYVVDFTGTSGIVKRKWLPWNPTVEVTIKKIGNQIALYAREFRDLEIPEENESIGFDLIIADWVSPYGKGKRADLVFRMDRKPEEIVPIQKVGRYGKETKTLLDVTLTVSGSNEGDGFILVPRTKSGKGPVSGLRMPRKAPAGVYQAKVVKRGHNTPDGPLVYNIRDDANYFFRVRTVKDEQGNIISALYGKMHGDFRFEAHVPKKISFTYYLNPTPNDRNLEFDTEKNLFDLPISEKVRKH